MLIETKMMMPVIEFMISGWFRYGFTVANQTRNFAEQHATGKTRVANRDAYLPQNLVFPLSSPLSQISI